MRAGTLFLLAAPLVAAAPLKLSQHAKNTTTHTTRDTVDDTTEQTEGSDFSLTLLKRDDYVKPSGLKAMVRAYSKFNIPLTDDLLTAMESVEKRATITKVNGTIAANPPADYDYEYIVPVSIGTPPQKVNLNLDTGSADLWVMSSETPKDQVSGQAIYTPSKSTTAKKVAGQSFNVLYGDGSGASGNVYTDKVTLGNINFPSQVVESATSVSSSFTYDSYSSGMIGLGMSSGNSVQPTRALTFMENMKPYLNSALFTANLKHQQGGNYNFGYINAKEYTGSIQYAAIDKTSAYWQISVDGYSVGAQPSSAKVTSKFTAIVDTATTLLLLPPAVVQAYYAKVKGASFDANWGAYTFPCSSTMPDWAFTIGSYRGILPGRYVNYGNLDDTICYGGMQSSGSGSAIFGDILLKSQFVVFDLGNSQVGFANKALTS